MPACMIIFKILFSQKHCTLYLYSNGHIWIPIYEFEICVSVKKHANRTPTFGNGFGIQKRLQKVVQVSSILPWTSHGNNICFTEIFVTILKRVVKWAKNNLLQHVPAFAFILKWEKKTSSHFEIISFINIYNKTPPKGWNDDENETLHWIMKWGWMRWKWNLAFNNDDGKNCTQKTIYIKKIKK